MGSRAVTFLKATYSKWIPIIFLGVLGCFLSEVLSWNVKLLRQAIAKGPIQTVALVFLTVSVYIWLFAFFLDIIIRLRIRSFTSLCLLGSVYGLILEGLLGKVVFFQGRLGPSISGLYLVNVAFPALSWHVLLDFWLAIFIFNHLMQGYSGMSRSSLNIWEGTGAVLLTFFWFFLSVANWQFIMHPQGIPLKLQVCEMIFSFFMIGFTAFLALPRSFDRTRPLFRWYHHLFSVLFFLFLVKARSSQVPAHAFMAYIVITGIYCILFFVYQFSENREKNMPSFKPCNFSWVKYMKLCFIVLFTYLVLWVTSRPGILGLKTNPMLLLYQFLVLSSVFVMVLFSALLPLWAVAKMLTNIFRKKHE